MNENKKDKLGVDINNLDLTPVIEEKDNALISSKKKGGLYSFEENNSSDEGNVKKDVKLFPDIIDDATMKNNSNLSNNIVNKLEDDEDSEEKKIEKMGWIISLCIGGIFLLPVLFSGFDIGAATPFFLMIIVVYIAIGSKINYFLIKFVLFLNKHLNLKLVIPAIIVALLILALFFGYLLII